MAFRFGLLWIVLFATLLSWEPVARAANDPRLAWKSIETRHFRITYYSTEEEVAAHLADLAEDIYGRLVPAIGLRPCPPEPRPLWRRPECGGPEERTEILLTDQTDSANGSATALPYNAIRLNVTAPDDMSPLGDVDDWYLELLTHEYTHIEHTDHIRGFWALINGILGKTYAPNQLEPRWMLEGLAIFEESARTTGGRLRSSMWNMFMRADVLEKNVAPLDVFSNTPRRWPQGNIWYLYGSFFMRWIAETYGEQAIRTMIDDYAWQVFPFAINRSVRRATGRTFEELYGAWIDSLDRSFRSQAAAIEARGLREGYRLTHTGNGVEHPRWIPRTAWPDHVGQLAYYVNDNHTTEGYYALPLVRDADGRIAGAKESARELLIRGAGVGGLSFLPDGACMFSTVEVYNNLFAFDDLFELDAHAKAATGFEVERVRLTKGWRAIDPSVSPDGRSVVFTTNHRGTGTLMIADLEGSDDRPGGHVIVRPRTLVPSAPFDQAFTPRFSPDGKHVAYSAWQHGGFRDVRIVDVASGAFVEITHDRAIDGDPVFSADGRWLYFHSDRTGVMNVYAYEIATSRLMQVTNVINGAYQPEPSPDGKWLAYVGYTHEGYDVFVMPLDPPRWLQAPDYVDDRGPPPADPAPASISPHAYDPWPTLRPRALSFQTTPGNFGQALVTTVSGGDIAGIHAFTGSLITEWDHPQLEGSFAYSYGRLPFDVSASVSRTLAPQGNYQLGIHPVPWIQEAVLGTTAVAYSIPHAFDSTAFSLSYSFGHVGGSVPLPVDKLNPYDIPLSSGQIGFPSSGLRGILQLGWSYSNAQGFLWGVGAEHGMDASVGLGLSDPLLASDTRGYYTAASLATYQLLPWLRHHVLALRWNAGASGGDTAGQGRFFIGGFHELPLINVVQNSLIQGSGFQLRGYPIASQVGFYYALFNGEIRFPIVNIDRGLSSLPIFLQRVNGAVFIDYGSAFDDPSQTHLKTGTGGELWFDAILGYTLGFTFRTGYARGLSSGGIDKTYFVAAVPF